MYYTRNPTMLAPPRSPYRPPPPPSPSTSLLGMENVVPPRGRSSSASPFSPVANRNKPLPSRTPPAKRSPFSPAADKDKPLPARPYRSSSIYSADSRYTRIIDRQSYYSWDEEQPPVPPLIQPIAYQETISALLRRRLDEPPSPKSAPSALSIATLGSQEHLQSQSVSPESPAASAISVPSVADSRNAPSFKEFSRNLQKKRIQAVDAPSALSLSPPASPNFRAVSYDSTQRDRSISPRTSDTVDQGLVPAPLSIYKRRETMIEDQSNVNHYRSPELDERSTSRFSQSSSEDSYVIYTGVTQSVRAYVRHKMHKKRDNQKVRKRVMSVASAKYPGMLIAKEYDRRHSSTSRRASLQQGISSVYRRLSRLSISSPPGQDKDKKSPRGRQKQLAIPTSAYQKYGAAVWEAPKRQKKPMRTSAPTKTLVKKAHNDRVKSMPANPTDVSEAFKSGRSQIIRALGGTKHRLKRSNSEKRREALKQSIKLVGPADLVSDGTMTYTV